MSLHLKCVLYTHVKLIAIWHQLTVSNSMMYCKTYDYLFYLVTVALQCLSFTLKGCYRSLRSMTKSHWAKTTEDESRAECFFFRLPGMSPVEAAHGHPNWSWHPTLGYCSSSTGFCGESTDPHLISSAPPQLPSPSNYQYFYKSVTQIPSKKKCPSNANVQGWCTGGIKALCLTGS